MSEKPTPRSRHASPHRRGRSAGSVAPLVAGIIVLVVGALLAYLFIGNETPPRKSAEVPAPQPEKAPVESTAAAIPEATVTESEIEAPETTPLPAPPEPVAAKVEDSAEQLNDRTYWFGNTWGGRNESGHWTGSRFMQMAVEDFAIAGENIFTICHWDEHGSEAGVYTTSGEKVVALDGWHSWGRAGGTAATVDERYAYLSMGHNPGDGGGENYAGVARYTHSGKPAGFPGAKKRDPGCHLAVNEDHTKKPTGLAVHAGELFVSDPSADRIRVYATEGLSHLRDMPFPAPGRIEIDAGASHDLWIIDTAQKVVRRMSRAGKLSRVRITDCKQPVAVCLDTKGNILVADGALDRQCIRAFRASNGSYITGSEFGSPIYVGKNPGLVAPRRFYRITSIRCDADDNLYVGCWDGGGKLHKYDSARREVWVLKGLEFVSCGDVDPAEDTNLYSNGHRYTLDYDKQPGEGWKELSITLDPLSYPNDPRLKADYWMSMRMYRLGGKKLMLGKAQMGSELYLWRFDGEIAVPAAIYTQNGIRVQGTPAENFSVRWTGHVTPRISGSHVFTTCSDDGIRLWVNATQLVDNWTGHGPTDDSGTIDLEAGRSYPIKVEYYQGGGGCCMQLFWREPGQARRVVPAEVLSVNPGSSQKGLAAEYFRGTALGDSAQKRVDPQIDFALFTGDIASSSFGAPKTEGWPPHRPTGPFIWSDANGDGDMQPDEYMAAPRGAQPTMIDLEGNLWTNTDGWDAGKGSITKIPFAGLTPAGAPRWDPEGTTSTPIPTEGGLQKLSKLHYDSANDSMYIGAWTDDHPFPGGGWEQMSTGPVLLRFDTWSTKPTLAWRRSIVPPEGTIGKVPKSWSFEADHVFVGHTWKHEQIAVEVYRLDCGARVGRLLPTADIGGVTGWTDMNDSVQTHRRADGTYVVFVEEVWMAKGIYYLWKP